MGQKMIYGELLSDQLRQLVMATQEPIAQDEYYQLLKPWMGVLIDDLRGQLHESLLAPGQPQSNRHRWKPYQGPIAATLAGFAAEGQTSCYYVLDLAGKMTGTAAKLRMARRSAGDPAVRELLLSKVANWLNVMTGVTVDWWGVDPKIDFGIIEQMKKDQWEALCSFSAPVELHW